MIEIAAVAVIASIGSALAIPSMMGAMGRSSLQSTASQVKGAFQEAQRAAIRNGSTCTVAVVTTGITGSPAGCITSPVTFPSGISLDSSSSPQSSTFVSFSYKGNPNNSADLTVVLTSNRTTEKRCIVIAPGIGIMRSGIYGNSCTTAF